MEIINKLPIELMREIIKYDIHPVAELFKKGFYFYIDDEDYDSDIEENNKVCKFNWGKYVLRYRKRERGEPVPLFDDDLYSDESDDESDDDDSDDESVDG